jgi:hypothetical protein
MPMQSQQGCSITLAYDFAQSEFLNQGMITDLYGHWNRAGKGTLKTDACVM